MLRMGLTDDGKYIRFFLTKLQILEPDIRHKILYVYIAYHNHASLTNFSFSLGALTEPPLIKFNSVAMLPL